MTMFDSRTKLSQQVVSEVREHEPFLGDARRTLAYWILSTQMLRYWTGLPWSCSRRPAG